MSKPTIRSATLLQLLSSRENSDEKIEQEIILNEQNERQQEASSTAERLSSKARFTILPSPCVVESGTTETDDKIQVREDFKKLFELFKNRFFFYPPEIEQNQHFHPFSKMKKNITLSISSQEPTSSKIGIEVLLCKEGLNSLAYQFFFGIHSVQEQTETPLLSTLFYSGHGYPANYQSDPVISRFPTMEQYSEEQKKQPIQGGEIVLHARGAACFEAAVHCWRNRIATVKNKHLLLVIDACYSGHWVEDLKKFSTTQEAKKLRKNRNFIHVQSSSEAELKSDATVFTTMFAALNTKKIREELEQVLLNQEKCKEFEKTFDCFGVPTPCFFSMDKSLNDRDIVEISTKQNDENNTIHCFGSAKAFKVLYMTHMVVSIGNSSSTPKQVSPAITEEALLKFIDDQDVNESKCIEDVKLTTYSDGYKMAIVLLRKDNHRYILHPHFDTTFESNGRPTKIPSMKAFKTESVKYQLKSDLVKKHELFFEVSYDNPMLTITQARMTQEMQTKLIALIAKKVNTISSNRNETTVENETANIRSARYFRKTEAGVEPFDYGANWSTFDDKRNQMGMFGRLRKEPRWSGSGFTLAYPST